MGLPWLDSPVLLHSSRADKCTLTAAQCAFRRGHWRYWYQADHVFGHATIYFICAVVGVFTISNILSRLSRSPKGNGLRSNGLWQRFVALSRYNAYRSFHLRGLNWFSPSVGVMLLGVCGAVYFFALTLGPKPYYWPNTKHPSVSYGGSPPLATRTGWMSLALLPFVMILASKANYVTLFTGISHEKLQVFHRWDMMMQWKMSVVYWTGVAALIPQAWLNIMSIGPIRNRYYEFFKSFHYIAIILFIFFLFIHCDFRLTSWDYFIASLTLYLSSLCYSFGRMFLRKINHVPFLRHTHHASLLILPDGIIQLSVPTTMTWSAGQHVFLRFWGLGVHSFSTHPFTISSLPSSGLMVFYIKPHTGGLTERLHNLANQSNGNKVAVSIDGPYGHSSVAQTLSTYDKVLLVAGGSGSTFILPILEALTFTPGQRAIKIVVATKSTDSSTWFVDAVSQILSQSTPQHGANTKVQVYITSPTSTPTDTVSSNSDLEKALTATATSKPETGSDISSNVEAKNTEQVSVITNQGRPDLQTIIAEQSGDAILGIAACGPEEMMLDARNACADAQVAVLAGRKKEVWLHCESFGW
ncbi:hypothetical protein BP5796_10250 [Coleophoma crateriformis]|uniref:ferric-chelate reductase (NADPH) n=1 Tax=Coleophoma crateriformis TaxID=565419 RepID=A0A3D8QV36_9HELO|nr:hypothetical protein BP5796_10250 [Coleophoma crateriformis]